MMLLLLGLLAMALAGCGTSPHTHYYTLTPAGGSSVGAAATGKPIDISQVTIPSTLDRDSIVESSDSGELDISNRDRWAAPLDDMIRSVLATDLHDRLPGMVTMPGDPVPPEGTRSVIINVRHFAATDGKQVVLLADWSLMSDRPSQPLMTRSESITIPLRSNDAKDVVSAMSAAIGELSLRIASAVATQPQRSAIR